MPYIPPYRRQHLDCHIDRLASRLVHLGASPGDLNYSITRLLILLYGIDPTYSKIASAMGTLECVKAEFYRKVAAPYEDKKATENGQVYP